MTIGADERSVAAMHFEAEYMRVLWKLVMEFVYTRTRAGWDGHFGALDVVEFWRLKLLPVMETLEQDWTQVLPNTAKAINRIESSPYFPQMPELPEEVAATIDSTPSTTTAKTVMTGPDHAKMYRES